MGTRTLPLLLLGLGYVTAAVSALGLRRAFRTRRARPLVVFEAATAAVVVGWSLRQKWQPAAVNLVLLTAVAAGWFVTGRRRPRPSPRPPGGG